MVRTRPRLQRHMAERRVILLVILFVVSLTWCLSEGFAPFPGPCGGWCRSKKAHHSSSKRSFGFCDGDLLCIRRVKRFIIEAKLRERYAARIMGKLKHESGQPY